MSNENTIDAASANTKQILQDVLRIELTAFDPRIVELSNVVRNPAADPTAIGFGCAMTAASEDLAAATKIKAKADACLADTNHPPNTPNTCLLYTSPSPRD